MEDFEKLFKEYINEITFNLDQKPYEITHEQESSISKEYYIEVPNESGQNVEYVVEFERSKSPQVKFISFTPVGRNYNDKNEKGKTINLYRFVSTIVQIINKELEINPDMEAIAYSAEANKQGNLTGRPKAYENFFKSVVGQRKIGRLTNYKELGEFMGDDYFVVYSDEFNLEDIKSEF